MYIIGYTHSDGYCLCGNCYYKALASMSNEQTEEFLDATSPIFDNQDEWDFYPTCDICHEEIDEVQLTSDGIDWLNSTGRKADWQSYDEMFPSDVTDFYVAYYNGNNAYCLDCFCSDVLDSDSKKIAKFRQDCINENPTNAPECYDVFTERSLEFTPFPYDQETIICHACHEVLFESIHDHNVSMGIDDSIS